MKRVFETEILLRILSLLVTALTITGCRSEQTLKSQTFDYAALTGRFYLTRPDERFPLTVQRGINKDPFTLNGRYLFYTSLKDGASDIWMRDLTGTVNIPIVRHPSRQSNPSVSSDGRFLAFISFDRDSGGDLMITRMPDGPKPLVDDALSGITPENLWDDSVNISEWIERFSEEGAECSGQSQDGSPYFNPDGTRLYFTSNRCGSSTPEVWSVPLKKGLPAAIPERITRGGAYSLSVDSEGKLIYLSYRNRSTNGSIILFDPASGLEREVYSVPLSDRILIASPVTIPGSNEIFFIKVREDTNRDGVIGLEDRGSIYSFNIDERRETVMMDSSAPLHGLHHSLFNEGTILYPAEENGHVNIYQIPRSGQIPKQNSIDGQYESTKSYLKASVDTYFLSLDAVKNLFMQDPAYPVYEGLTLIDRFKRLRREKMQPPAGVIRVANDTAGSNPYASILLDIDKNPGMRIELLRDAIESNPLNNLAGVSKRIVRARLIEDLSASLSSAGRYQEALEAIRRVNREFLDYPWRDRSLYLEGTLSIRLEKGIPAPFIALMGTGSRSVQNAILNDLYKFLRYENPPTVAGQFVEKEIRRVGIPPQIRSTMKIAQASHLFDSGNLQEAEKILNESIRAVPEASGVQIKALQILALILERTDRFSQAMDTRILYGGMYSSESGASVDLEEFLEIVNGSLSIINRYRETGDRLAGTVNARLRGSGGLLGFGAGEKTGIEIKGIDRELLADFCNEKSPVKDLIFRLGQLSYVQQYGRFCGAYMPYYNETSKDSPAVEDLKSAVELLYLVSFSNANIMNILFLNMKRAGLFLDFHKEQSIRYHRLKVDIAMELINHKLKWADTEIQLLKTEEIESLILERDPFDATLFNQLSHGYELGLPEARAYFDNSLLYGYAYMLIQKSMVRDRFYRKLLRKGDELSASILRKIKESVLRDLKNAEYQIQYILYTEPDSAEAYLLLGRMYQFIDTMRGSNMPLRPNIFMRTVNLLTDGGTPGVLDGRFYRDIYLNYFPDYLYESNVELYKQALELVDDSNHTVRTSLLLNLAGNYFILMNYRNASRYYSELEQLMKRSGIWRFDSYAQEALYFLNHGRSLLYEGNAKEASARLHRARETLLLNEMNPLAEKYQSVRTLSSAADEGDSDAVEVRTLYDTARYRMAVIDSLIGLSETISGNHEGAIDAYRSAYNILYKTDHIPERRISGAALLNYMAIELQRMSRFDESDSYARQAESDAEKAGLTRDHSLYQAQTAGGKLLGLLLDFGEDFSVIGEGRNPYGFPPLRQYELALGIRLENRILQGDIEGSLDLIERRKSVFLEQDGDVLLGKRGYLNSLNQEAYGGYLSGDYAKAASLFLEAVKWAERYGITESHLINLNNYFISRFEILRSHSEASDSAVSDIERDLKLLHDFREKFFHLVRRDYIAQKESEIQDYTYSEELDGPAVEKLVNRKTAGLLSIESTLYAFLGEYYDRRAETEEEIHSAREAQRRGIEAIDRALAVFVEEGHGITRTLRLRINRGMILLASDRPRQALRDFRSVHALAYEYNAVREMWEAKFGILLSNLSIRSAGGSGEESLNALIPEMLELIDRHPEIRSEIGASSEEFFRIAADDSIRREQPDQARSYLRASWSLRLENEFLKFSIRFRDESKSALFSEIRKTLLRMRQLSREDVARRYERSDLSRIGIERSELAAAFRALRSKFLLDFPEYSSFFWNRQGPLRSSSPSIRFFRYGNAISCWYMSSRGTTHFQTIMEDRKGMGVKRAAEACIGNENPDQISIITDDDSILQNARNVMREILPGIKSITHTTSETDTAAGFLESPGRLKADIKKLNVFNVRRDSIFDAPGEESGLKTFEYLQRRFIFQKNETGFFDPRAWISEEKEASVILIRGSPGSARAGMIYEIARAAGTGSVIFQDEDGPVESLQKEAGTAPYSTYGMRVYGIDGFNAERMKKEISGRARELYESANRRERQGDFDSATRMYGSIRSILSSLGDGDETEFKAGLRLLFINTVRRSPRRDEQYENMIQSYPGRIADIMRNRIEALYESGELEEASRLMKRYATEFPKEGASHQAEFERFEFKSRLGKTTVLKPDFSEKRFEEVLTAFRRGTEASRHEIAPSLLRMGHHLTAHALGSPVVRFESAMDEFILGLNVKPPEITETVQSSPYYPFASAAIQQRPGDERSVEGEDVLSLWLLFLRKEVYGLWSIQKFLDGQYLKKATLAQRSSIFRMLLEVPEFPSRSDQVSAISGFIRETEHIDGTDRASLLSLIAAEYMLRIGSFDAALELFLNHLRIRNSVLPEPRHRLFEARTGILLMAAGRLTLASIAAATSTINIEHSVSKWNSHLNESGFSAFTSLILAIPKNFDADEINILNGALTTHRPNRETLMLISMILKERAVRSAKPGEILNSEFFENDSVTLNREPVFSNRISGLQKKIPAGQTLVALVESNGALFRISLTAGGIRFENTKIASSIVVSRLRRYYRMVLAEYDGNDEAYQDTSRFMRHILNPSKNGINYIYLPVRYFAAPLMAERGDGTYQIFDPVSLAENTPSNDRLAEGEFAIRTMGGASPEKTKDEWTVRMRGLERIALSNSSPNSNGPLHIFNFRSLKTFRSNSPWFLSEPMLGQDDLLKESGGSVNDRIRAITGSFTAPGIATIFKKDHPCHPLFVRSYYERSKQNSIQKRYIDASLAVQRSPQASYCMTAYRPVTNSFVSE